MKSKRTFQRKQVWSTDEDNELTMLVSLHGENGCWPMIASQMNSRTGKQCRERYINHLSPHIKHSPWTNEEDDTILKLHAMIGTKWCKFLDYLPGRSDNAIKNRWHLLQRASIQRSKQRASTCSTIEQLLGRQSDDLFPCSDQAIDRTVGFFSSNMSLSLSPLELMMDDDLIMELRDIMELPTPVPPAKRLCCRDASVRGSDERSISSTDDATSCESSGNDQNPQLSHDDPPSVTLLSTSTIPHSMPRDRSDSMGDWSSLHSFSSDLSLVTSGAVDPFLMSDCTLSDLHDVVSDRCDTDYGSSFFYDCFHFKDISF